MLIPMPNQLGISVTGVVPGEPGHQSHSCPKLAIVNLVEQVEEGAKVENEDVGIESADPYSFTPNEI